MLLFNKNTKILFCRSILPMINNSMPSDKGFDKITFIFKINYYIFLIIIFYTFNFLKFSNGELIVKKIGQLDELKDEDEKEIIPDFFKYF